MQFKITSVTGKFSFKLIDKVQTVPHIAKFIIFENNMLTIGEQKNAIHNFYNLLLKEFRLIKHCE